MSNAEVEREIILALELSRDPITRHQLYKECPGAMSVDHISRALNELKKRGIVQNFGNGRWDLTGNYEENERRPAESKAKQVADLKRVKIETLRRLAAIVSDDISAVLLGIAKDIEKAK